MIYRLIFEKMPDENTNPVWTTQTSQNNQVVTNQSWDDFVLDFWENGSNESVWTPEIETDNLEDNTNEDEKDTQNSVDLNFDNENMFNEESEKSESENNGDFIDFQEETTENENDFDISLNDDSINKPNEVNDESWQEDEERTEIEDNYKTENENIENENIEDIDTENDVNPENTENQEDLENSEENLIYPENKSTDQSDEINDEEIGENNTETEDEDNLKSGDADETEESPLEANSLDFDNNGDISDVDQTDDEKVEDDKEISETMEDIVDDSSQEAADSLEVTETQLSEESEEPSTDLEEWEKSESSNNEETLDVQQEPSPKEEKLLEDTAEEPVEQNQDIDATFNPVNEDALYSNIETTWWGTESIFKEISENESENNTDIDMNNPNEESLNQPEITSLLWNMPEDSTEINTENDTDTNITNFELDENPVDSQENDNSISDETEWKDDNNQTVQEGATEINTEDDTDTNITNFELDENPVDSQENDNPVSDIIEWKDDSNQTVQEGISEDDKPEEQSFLLDYQETDKPDNNENHITLDNNVLWTENWNEINQFDINSINDIASSYVDTWNESETNKIENADLWNQNVVQSTNIDTDNDTMSQTETHQITSTLSLDQILDSELNDNPQFTDNSTSVPRNVPLNSWSLAKKVWILAWIGVFALAGYFLFLKSPDVNIGELQPEATELVEDYPEDTTDHSSASEDENEVVTEDSRDTDFHPAKSTIEQESLEEDRGGEDLQNPDPEDLDSWKPEPYVCEDWYCAEEPEFPEAETPQEHQPEDILEVISNYKLEAESYYSQWDEIQDKKLVKLSLQVIHQCDVYKEQVENGEWLDDESFSSFKSKVDWLFAKIEEYRSWNTMDESEKEELKEFIYQMANW